MNIWFQLLILVILLGVIFVIITENRNPFKTLAWVLVLIFVPVLGLLMYLLFGMDNRHRRLISEDNYDRLKQNVTDVHPDLVDDGSLGRYDALSQIMFSTNKAFVMDGNSVEPYIDFKVMTEHLVEDLEQAQDHIHMMFFKFEEDPVGQRIADVLIRKAHEGVKVRFMYDDIANFMVRKKFYRHMAEEGDRKSVV